MIAAVAPRSQLDLLINALVLTRKASNAVDTALGLPASDRAQLDENLDKVRSDLGRLLNQVGAAIPGAGVLGRRPEVRTAAGVVEFLARQGAAQLGAVASVADTLRSGGDSRTLAQKIHRQLSENGVASREELAQTLGLEPRSPQFQEALERALGSGLAEWYAPNVFGIPRRELENLADSQPPPDADAEPMPAQQDLRAAVTELEGSLADLSASLRETEADPE